MGAVDTTYTFTATDTITSTKMNNIIDQTTMTGDAIIGTTLEVATGKLKVRAAGITSNELASNSVTTNSITDLNVITGKIADLAVTTGKLADLGVTTGKIADNAVTTIKVLDSNITPAKLSQPLTLATAQASTSGTSVDFTSIPSWVKKITVMLAGVSTNGTSELIVQLGDSGGFETTGYIGSTSFDAGRQSFTNGIGLGTTNSAAYENSGIIVLVKVDSSANKWVAAGNIAQTGNSYVYSTASLKETSEPLDRIRITTSGGVNTFDAGQVNIMYE